MSRLTTILYKLFRFKPTIAWSICGILLGIAVAINEHGTNLNWIYLLIAVLPVVLMQGFIAHAVNDIEDEEVDKKTDMKGTNRFKVLVSGITSREELAIISTVLLTITSLAGMILFIRLGFPIFIFYGIALYAALGYSLPPLKLGWRPYAEWTVVLPVLVTLVVAVNYVATGSFSYLAFVIGVMFALFNIVWFLVSRMMDYHPDKKAGKVTTFVKYGIYSHRSSDFFVDNIHPYLATVMLLLFWYIVYVGIFVNPYVGIFSTVSWFGVHYFVPRNDEISPIVLSIKRTYLILISIINSIVLFLILLLL